MKDAQIFSVIEAEHYRFTGRDEDDEAILIWEKELNFYHGDLSEINLANDWRTNEVKGKRKAGILLGLITNPSFPVSYPLQLNNGHVCEDIYAKVCSDEADYNESI